MDDYQDTSTSSEKNQDSSTALEKALHDESGDPIKVPFSFLEAITKEFSDDQLIGKGGFGSVYTGQLRNGMVVAVKKLRNTIEILEENFQREVACLIAAKHKNIVRFLGYCYETQHAMRPYKGRLVWADERHMLFCFEYLSKGNLSNYLTEPSTGLPWNMRYQIIKGICEALCYLHQQHIVHLDLKPQNILLDDSMMPKIVDFGLSRRLSESQSRNITKHIVGTPGYMAPEFISNQSITSKLDVYSLGVIIIEILLGCKERPTVDKVLESWTNMISTSETYPLLVEQVKVCAEIGINCTDNNPENRPDIQGIIQRLDAADISNSSVRSVVITSSAGQLVDEMKSVTVYSPSPQQEQSALDRFYQYYRVAKKACKPIQISTSTAPGKTATELGPWLSEDLLHVHPLELCFPFETKKRIRCSLNIINRTGRHVCYWIRPPFPHIYTSIVKSCYILCQVSTSTADLTMVEQEQPPLEAGMSEILMITVGSHKDMKDMISFIGNDYPRINDVLLKQVEELGGKVYAAMLRVVTYSPRDAPKILWREKVTSLRTIDVHPTEPWILVGHDKYVSILDYEKKETIAALEVEVEACHEDAKVVSVIFIPQKQWFVTGDNLGYIHVYMCYTMQEIKRFKANGHCPVMSLAIHPDRPWLLSACHDGVIQLWDWDIGWTCCRDVHSFSNDSTGVWILAKFNPKDINTFTSHDHGSLKVWSIHPSRRPPITTVEKSSSSHLYDHVFTEAGPKNHVVIITNNGLKIWDLETNTRVHSFRETRCTYTAVACHPRLPLIAAGTMSNKSHEPGVVCQLWNSTKYRLEKTVSCTSGNEIKCLGFAGTSRLVIGTEDGIEVLEIDMESLVSQA